MLMCCEYVEGNMTYPRETLGQGAAFQPDRPLAMFAGAQDRGCVSGLHRCSSPGTAAEPWMSRGGRAMAQGF